MIRSVSGYLRNTIIPSPLRPTNFLNKFCFFCGYRLDFILIKREIIISLRNRIGRLGLLFTDY